MSITALEAFERGTDTFNAHDIDGFAEVLAEDVTFTAPGGMSGEGKDACVEFYGGWLNAFPDGKVEVHRVHIADEVVTEEGTFSGTHDGVLRTPNGEIPPTGRSMSLPYIQVLHFRDGKHASFNLVFDRLSMMEQLGLVPEPAA